MRIKENTLVHPLVAATLELGNVVYGVKIETDEPFTINEIITGVTEENGITVVTFGEQLLMVAPSQEAACKYLENCIDDNTAISLDGKTIYTPLDEAEELDEEDEDDEIEAEIDTFIKLTTITL